MNIKKSGFTIAGVLLILIISSYFYGIIELKSGEREFALHKDIEVTAVHIMPPEGEKIILQKDNIGQWLIDAEYRANEFAVRDLIRTIRHFEVRQPVSVAQQKLVNEKLDHEGVLVNIYVEGYLFDFFSIFGLFKTSRLYNSLIVGDNTIEPMGTLMRKVNSDNPYIVYLPGYPEGLANVFTPEKHIWFDPVVVDLEAWQIKKVKVITEEQPEESFKLKVYEDFDFYFYDLEGNRISDMLIIDTAKVLRFLSSFKGLYYESLLTYEAFDESEELIFPQYAFRIVIDDLFGSQYAFDAYRKYRKANLFETNEIGPKYDPDRFYLELHSGKRALAQYYVFGRILRPLSFFTIEQ